MPEKLTRKQLDDPKTRIVDVKLLKEQAELVGLQADIAKGIKAKVERRHLEGVWNLLHVILDDLERGRECILERK